MATKDDVLQIIQARGVAYIDLWFTDITGEVKSMTIPSNKLAWALEHGAHFDGSALDGFARQAESDMMLVPDTRTFSVLPWSVHNGLSAKR